MRHYILVALAATLLPAGGCVFWDIRDEVKNTNSRLDAVEAQLASTNAGLEGTNSKLEGVNAQLKEVETSLERLDATNQSLANVEDRLTLLRSLDTSLAKVDVHLASLRKTIGRIDGMIPFLDLGTEGEPEPEVAEAPAPAEPAAAAPAEGAAPKEAAPVRRDALIGVWISQYPDRATVVVLEDGGRYALQRAAAPQASQPAAAPQAAPAIESGTWKREGKRIVLVSEPREVTRADGTKSAESVTVTWEIISQSVKSMALRSERGVVVFAKP